MTTKEDKKIEAVKAPKTTPKKSSQSSVVSKKSTVVAAKSADKNPANAEKIVREVAATVRYVRMAPRKIRLVIEQLRGLAAQDAFDRLYFIRKSASEPVAKLLKSAMANAENNFEIDRKNLFVKSITANDGPTIKRYTPKAHGRSATIRKRTSTIDLILGVKQGTEKKLVKKVESKEDLKIVNPDEIKKDRGGDHGSADQKGSTGGRNDKGFMKGVFQRKTG